MPLASCSRVSCVLVAVSCLLLATSAASLEEDNHDSLLTFKEGDACGDESGGAGVCARRDQCPSVGNDYTAAAAATAGCTPSESEELVCCMPQPSAFPEQGRSSITRLADIKCEEYTAEPYNSPAATEFPHMAAIGWRTLAGNISFLCGGALISERFVLTAGHCLQTRGNDRLADPTPTLVRLGVVNVGDALLTATPGLLDVPIKTRVPHPSYKSPTKYFDVGLLELAQAVPFDDHLRPACLWTSPDFSPHSAAVITSWKNSDDLNDEALELIKTEVELWSDAACDLELGSSQGRSWAGLRDHQFCTAEPAHTACEFGDSGGPVQVLTGKRYTLLGMTSFGKGCNLNRPGVNTRLASVLDWIEEAVWPAAAAHTQTATDPQPQ